MGNTECANRRVVGDSLKNLFFKRRSPRITRPSTNAPGTKGPIISKALMKASKHCVVGVISVWKPFPVHEVRSSSISAHHTVTLLGMYRYQKRGRYRYSN